MARGRRGWVIGVALACAVPSVCSAAPPADGQVDPPLAVRGNPRLWYGWQTFSADAAAGALFLGAVADDHSTTLFGFSGLAFALGAPTIHVVHGRSGVALGSLGLRILGPFIGAVIGSASDVRTCDDVSACGPTSSKWATTGAGIGGLVVSAIDGALLAYDAPTSSNLPPPRNQLLGTEPLPQLIVLRHGIGIGYSGQF